MLFWENGVGENELWILFVWLKMWKKWVLHFICQGVNTVLFYALHFIISCYNLKRSGWSLEILVAVKYYSNILFKDFILYQLIKEKCRWDVFPFKMSTGPTTQIVFFQICGRSKVSFNIACFF